MRLSAHGRLTLLLNEISDAIGRVIWSNLFTLGKGVKKPDAEIWYRQVRVGSASAPMFVRALAGDAQQASAGEPVFARARGARIVCVCVPWLTPNQLVRHPA